MWCQSQLLPRSQRQLRQRQQPQHHWRGLQEVHHLQRPLGGCQPEESEDQGRDLHHQQAGGLLADGRDDAGDHPQCRHGAAALPRSPPLLLPQQERAEGEVQALLSPLQPGQISESHQDIRLQKPHGTEAKGRCSLLRWVWQVSSS